MGGGRFSRRARKYLLNWEDNNRHYPRVLADIGKYFTFVNIEKSGFLDTPSALHPGSLRLVWTSISGQRCVSLFLMHIYNLFPFHMFLNLFLLHDKRPWTASPVPINPKLEYFLTIFIFISNIFYMQELNQASLQGAQAKYEIEIGYQVVLY